MTPKTVPPQPVLRNRRRLAIAQIGTVAGEACAGLADEAAARGLVPTGPVVFVAHGMPRDAQTEFDLDFCLPVDGPDVEVLAPFPCASLLVEGPLDRLFSHGYQPLLKEIAAAGLVPTAESREIYHRWEGPAAAGNRIEIQIGVRDA